MKGHYDIKYVKWKFMKVMHLQVRLIDSYLQLRDHNRIINPFAKT
jgi:hypothetical protein